MADKRPLCLYEGILSTLKDGDLLIVPVMKKISNVNLSQSSWSLVSTLYEYTYSNSLFTTTKHVEVTPQNSTIDIVIVAEILPYIQTNNGSIKMYSKKAPLGDILVDITLMEVL